MNYALRGKCKEYAEAAVEADKSLTLVRGHYYCSVWGKQQHWWTVRADGTIFDPTKDQFPSLGQGDYEPFNGICQCAECGVDVKEEDAHFYGNYPFCSSLCTGRFVGVY